MRKLGPNLLSLTFCDLDLLTYDLHILTHVTLTKNNVRNK